MWGENASLCLGRLESTPFDKFGGAIRTSTHRPQALNDARDEFPIPVYIISGIRNKVFDIVQVVFICQVLHHL